MRFITDWLVNSNVIEENEVSLYNYAIENFVLTATPFSLTLIYGFLIEVPVEAACIVLGFLVLLRAKANRLVNVKNEYIRLYLGLS